jgi:single-strand selective monofunctional uracil DNA glycosylase
MAARKPETVTQLITAAKELRQAINRLEFKAPVAHVYNPLAYAWPTYELYLRRYGTTEKSIVFLGMNPGPFGMVQTGVPFGEVAAVRDWLSVEAEIARPKSEHPRRPVTGFSCHRSEVSGRRLWGLFAERFGEPERFFAEHFVLNYCPLAFLESSGRNRTPDKLPAAERTALFSACDVHLRAAVAALRPRWLVAIGDFALQRARMVFPNGEGPRLGKILHPSPASPAANRDWSGLAVRQLRELGVWHSA